MLQLERRWIVVADVEEWFWLGVWASVLRGSHCDWRCSAGENEMTRGVDWTKRTRAEASARSFERSTYCIRRDPKETVASVSRGERQGSLWPVPTSDRSHVEGT